MSDSPTEHFEHAEHAEHVAHVGDPFLIRVSITIAFLAVAAAAVGSLESIETAETISTKTSAAIYQNQATDQWGFFSRESTKKSMYEIAADGATGDKAAAYKSKSAAYDAKSDEIQKKAVEIEEKVKASNEASERHEHRHQILTLGATALHISIAVATIAIVMRGARWPFYASVVLGAVGIVVSALAFV